MQVFPANFLIVHNRVVSTEVQRVFKEKFDTSTKFWHHKGK